MSLVPPGKRRLAVRIAEALPPPPFTDLYYPKVPSLAGDVSSGRNAFLARIGGLMVSGNEIGQRFGLRVCTSVGPDRTPILH